MPICFNISLRLGEREAKYICNPILHSSLSFIGQPLSAL